LSTQFQQATIPVADPATFDVVRGAIDQNFAAAAVDRFLRTLASAGLRIRDFEAVLAAGKLGPNTQAAYNKLNDGDQGQIREHYLAALEKVPGELREKYFKLYAYY
jgi:hypothetical protein